MSCPRAVPGVSSHPLPCPPAAPTRGSPDRVISASSRKRTQMQELESTAQETPGPAASRGPQPALSPSVVPWVLARLSAKGTHGLALQEGCAANTQQLENPGNGNSQGKRKKKKPIITPGEQAVPHHVRTKNKPAFSPGFGHFSYDGRANSLCARLTASGPRRTLALFSRQAQVCTTALPKREIALKTRNPLPNPAAEQLSCFLSGTRVYPLDVALSLRQSRTQRPEPDPSHVPSRTSWPG